MCARLVRHAMMEEERTRLLAEGLRQRHRHELPGHLTKTLDSWRRSQRVNWWGKVSCAVPA